MKYFFIFFNLFYLTNAFSMSFWNGLWKPPEQNLSFIIENDYILAQKDDAILKMDLFDIEKKNETSYRITLHNLKICETGKPKFNLELLTILRYIHIISNNGIILNINEMTSDSLNISWELDKQRGTFIIHKNVDPINNTTSDQDTDLSWIDNFF